MAPPSTVLGKLRAPDEPLQSRVQDAVWGTLMPLAKRVGETPIMGAKPPPWINIAIIPTSGFAQAPTGATPFLPKTAFHKNALGYVYGKVSVVTAAGAGPVVIFALPLGYRPLELLTFTGSDGGGANIWEASISPNGNFRIISALGAGGLFVGTFTFLAEQ